MGFRTALLIAIFSVFITPILKAQSNLTFTNGDSTGTIKFPATGCLYQWKNDNPSIGLIKSGSGDIESFKAINTGRVPITATITTNPVRELAYIASESNGTISVINTVTGHVDAKLSFSNFANYSVCVKPGGTAVYVSSGGSKVINVINTSTNLFSATITLDVFPNYLLASPDGNKLYVSSFTGGKVEVINTLTNTIISTIKQDSASTMAISPDGLKLYVGNVSTGKISVFNTADNTKIGSIETFGASNNPAKAIGSFLSFMVISPDGKELYGSAYGNNSYSNSLIVADLQKKFIPHKNRCRYGTSCNNYY